MKIQLSALAPLLTNKSLKLIILPTEQCNFRCSYCYEDFEHGKMTDEIVAAVKKLIDHRAPTLQHLEISWFGGEPLLGKEIIYDINAYASKLVGSNGGTFTSSITTNAFGLDSATLDRLSEHGVRNYQISFDGYADSHDKTRKLISGRGTFDRILTNVLNMRNSTHAFETLLRLHVHQENTDGIRTLISVLKEQLLDDPRFNIVIKPVGNWGGTSVKEMALVDEGNRELKDIQKLAKDIGWYKARPEIDINPAASDGTYAPVHACYAARPNSLVIRSTGRLAKCTVAFSDPRNDIGFLKPDGTVEIEADKMRLFMRGFKDLVHEELACPMVGMPQLNSSKVIYFAQAN